jgi:uncharacterized membrane protein YphA (DoxX/SURF4 family)
VTTIDNWFARNLSSLKTVVRIIFGVFWAIDGALKFDPGFVDTFPNMIKDAASGQPSWLAGWFSFWESITSSNPAFYVYSTALFEVAIAFCLIFGFMRKLSYTVSLFLSLMIWSVPEGMGGPKLIRYRNWHSICTCLLDVTTHQCYLRTVKT